MPTVQSLATTQTCNAAAIFPMNNHTAVYRRRSEQLVSMRILPFRMPGRFQQLRRQRARLMRSQFAAMFTGPHPHYCGRFLPRHLNADQPAEPQCAAVTHIDKLAKTRADRPARVTAGGE